MKRTRKCQAKIDVSTTSSTSYTSPYSNRLTTDELKSFPGCENIDDNEAEKIIESLYELGLLSYDLLYK